MRATNRFVTATLTLALVASAPSAVLAQEDAPIRDTATDTAPDPVTERVTDEVTDRPTDRITDKVTDRVTDRPTDRPIDRCLTSADNQRRCLDDHHPHDLNVRQLIWRLINAHEWQKLFRLLHWLGWL